MLLILGVWFMKEDGYLSYFADRLPSISKVNDYDRNI